jgi:tetratricopeptide (TPR) repeat protein
VEFAEKALALEPDSGMALAALANLRMGATMRLRQRHDVDAIIRDLERAVELDPHNSSAHNWLGLSLGLVGRLEDALQTFERCIDVAPRFGPCRENHYDVLWSLGRAAEAFTRMQASLAEGAVVSEYANLAMLAHFEERTAFLLLVNQSNWLPGWPRQQEVYEAYRDLDGDHAELLAELLEFHRSRPEGAASYLALLLVPMGAFDLLPEYAMLAWGPEYAGYRRSAQFRRYMHESGAVDYWRKHGYPPQCRPVGADDFECE